jgi:hypothetical protein
MVARDGVAQNLLRRIVAEGHELATHTVHHLDLATLSPEKIEEEIVGVETAVKAVFGAGAPPLTLLRAPFGRPYQSAAGSAAYQKVAPVVARHAVHVGWHVDSNDWMYQNDPDRVFNHVTGLIKKPGQGAHGVVLMHSINPQTVAALPRLIDYMRDGGFVFKLTEDVVRARFGGRSSAQLVGAPAPSPTGGTGGGGATGAGGTGGAAGGAGGSTGAGGAAGGMAGSGATAGTSGAGGRPLDAAPGSDAAPAPPRQDAAGGAAGRGSGGSGGTAPPTTPTVSGNGGCSFAGGPASAPAFALSLALCALAIGAVYRRRRG